MNDQNASRNTANFHSRRFFSFGLKLIAVAVVVSLPFAGALAQLLPKQRSAAAATTVLVSSVFAAGTGGNAMASANYRMLGVLGETGLPANQTTLSSQNFQHQPGFLAETAAASSASRVFLPTLMRNLSNYFPGSNEVEPNNTPEQANGLLQSGLDYHGYQDDTNDYFAFVSSNSGTITVDLTNPSGQGTQLQLLYQVAGNLVGYAGAAPFHISYNGPAGVYYVRVYTGSGFNSTALYSLHVTYL